jgi:hypothetical protein
MNISKIIIILLFFSNINLVAQSSKYIENERLNRVKNNISESFEYFHNLEKGDSILHIHKTYNKSGFLLTELIFEFSKQRDTMCLFSYKYRGDTLVKKNEYFKFDGYQSSNEFKNYSYDKKGNKIEIRTINNNGKKGYQKIIYDLKNQKVAVYYQGLNQNKFSVFEKYYYSKKDDLILSIKKYSENGDFEDLEKYQYDNFGNLICKFLLTDWVKNNIEFYSYNKNIFLIESGFQISIENPEVLKSKYEYDNGNNIIKVSLSTNNTLSSFGTITYKKFDY